MTTILVFDQVQHYNIILKNIYYLNQCLIVLITSVVLLETKKFYL